MIWKISTSLMAACACAAILSAQTPAAPAPAQQSPQITSPQTPDQGVRKPASTTITVEGCIQRNALAQSAIPGATATAGSTASSFILADAAKPVADAASAPLPLLTSTYRLDGAENELGLHVGHKVEIVGTVEEMSVRPGAAGDQARATTAATAPRLKVDTVRMLGSVCTPAL